MQLAVPIHQASTRGRSAGRGVTAVSESRTGQGGARMQSTLGRIFQAYFGCVHHGRSLGSPL